MKLRKTLALPFLAASLFFTGMSAGCATETEKHVKQKNLPREYGQILRNVEYYDYTVTLLDNLADLPHELQMHETTLNYLKNISADGLISKAKLEGLKKLDHDEDGLTSEEEKILGTDPLKPNPSAKYAIDKGIPYVEEIKKFDEDGVMSAEEKSTIDSATELLKLRSSDSAKKMNVAYMFSNSSKFNENCSYLKTVSDKALTNMLRFGIDTNVGDYISFVARLTDKNFARYALESRLCIEDRNLTESEKEFLKEPNKHAQKMFDEYMSAIGKNNPELERELKKLPDFQNIELRDVEGLEDIIAAAKTENKSAFDLMLNEGIKDKRKYCSPLEALLWIAYDREFNDAGLIDDDNFSFKKFSIDKLTKEGWLYTTESNGPIYERGKKSGSDNHNAKPISTACQSDRWKNLDEVADRLNSPTLITKYMIDNIAYDPQKWEAFERTRRPQGARTPIQTFNNKIGACMDQSSLVLYFLKQNGWVYNDFESNKTNSACILHAGYHFTCLYIQDNKFYVIDVGTPFIRGIKGPFEKIQDAATATSGAWSPNWNVYCFWDQTDPITSMVQMFCR